MTLSRHGCNEFRLDPDHGLYWTRVCEAELDTWGSHKYHGMVDQAAAVFKNDSLPPQGQGRLPRLGNAGITVAAGDHKPRILRYVGDEFYVAGAVTGPAARDEIMEKTRTLSR